MTKAFLQGLQEQDNERLDIPKVRRKTHTGGNEITALEQIIGNVGKFNKNGSAAGGDFNR